MGEPAPEGLSVDRVEWLDSGGRSGLLRVHGRRGGEGPLPELAVPTPAGEERFASLPDPHAGRKPGTWRGAYVVQGDVVAAAGDRMALVLASGTRIALPAPSTDTVPPPARPAEPEPEPSGGEVVDRAVLAERRARRAEAAEQAQARIAREALRAVEILELRAAELENRLAEPGAPPVPAPPPRAVPAPDPDPAVEKLRARIGELEAELARTRRAQVPPEPTPQAPPATDTERRVERLRSALASAVATIAELRVALHESRLQRRTSDLDHGADAVRLAVLASERLGMQAELRAIRERQTAADAREAELRENLERAEARATRAEEDREGFARRLAERTSELEEVRVQVAGLEDALAAARTAAEAASAVVAELGAAREEIERLRADLAAAETGRELAEASVTAALSDRRAGEVAQAARSEDDPVPAAAGPVDPARLGDLARELGPTPSARRGSPELVAGIDAAAAALRSATAERRAAPVPLRRALAAFAREDPPAAAGIVAGLLPGQWPAVARPVDYDLTISEAGTFSVRVETGGARVERMERPRRRGAELHLRADVLDLTELLAGSGSRPRRFGRVRFSGRRSALRALEGLPGSGMTLEAVLRAGGTLDPGLALRCLPHAVPPEWTAEHEFSVAHTLTEPEETVYLLASGSEGLRVVHEAPPGGPDATVIISRPAFAALLRGEAPPDRPTVRGDHAAVDALRGWADSVRRGAPPGSA